MQVLDCTRPMVVIPIPEHRMGEFTVGMKATVYPIDSTDAQVGKIIHISSAPQLGDDTSIQLEQSLTLHGIRAIVGFDDEGALVRCRSPVKPRVRRSLSSTPNRCTKT